MCHRLILFALICLSLYYLPSSSTLARTTDIFELSLHFDVNCTPVKFLHSILHCCDALVLTKTCPQAEKKTKKNRQDTQNLFSVSFSYKMCLQQYVIP